MSTEQYRSTNLGEFSEWGDEYVRKPLSFWITITPRCASDFRIGAHAGDERATLMRLTERYCVVLQTIAKAPELSFGRA